MARLSTFLNSPTRSKPQTNLLSVVELIDCVKKKYNIDKNRIYLVGYSMGGSSVINLLNKYPEIFDAAVAIAPVPQFDNIKKINEIPLWIMHGEQDADNPFIGSEKFYNELPDKTKVRFWRFKHTTHHNIISPILVNENIPEWLFQRRNSAIKSK